MGPRLAWFLFTFIFTVCRSKSTLLSQKLEDCKLHPDIESRIQRDVDFWGESGITEDVALSVCKFCNYSIHGRNHQEQQKNDMEQQTRHPRRQLQVAGGAGNCNKPQRVLIQNGTVYLTNLVAEERLGLIEHVGFLVELYEVSQVYSLPDVEFTFWFGDNAPAHTVINSDGTTTWPYSSAGTPAVIAWSKWNENAALVVPYSGGFRCPPDSWDILESNLEKLASVHWKERREIGFGRWNNFCTHYIPWMKTADGNVMECPRIHIPHLSKAHPDILDAYDLGKFGPVPLMHQNTYKYLISTDGWSISCKLDKYLLMGSAVFKAESTRYGFYYDAIKPYKHYIPFMVNSSDDIIEGIMWAKGHDSEAHVIAEKGQRFALKHLNRSARLCYYFQLITELSKKMRYKPRCERRELCVPLVREIRFLRSHNRTKYSCRYEEVLLRYAHDDPSNIDETQGPSSIITSLEEIERLHMSGTAWPRDDLRSM